MTPERIEALAERLADRLWSHMNCGCDIRPVIIEELTRHFAGDEQAVDEAWLRSVGFKDVTFHGNPVGWLRLACLRWESAIQVLSMDGWGTLNTKTRSDVRRLCEALGITLTEK